MIKVSAEDSEAVDIAKNDLGKSLVEAIYHYRKGNLDFCLGVLSSSISHYANILFVLSEIYSDETDEDRHDIFVTTAKGIIGKVMKKLCGVDNILDMLSVETRGITYEELEVISDEVVLEINNIFGYTDLSVN